MSHITQTSTVKSTPCSILKKSRFENSILGCSQKTILHNSSTDILKSQSIDLKYEIQDFNKYTLRPRKQQISKKIQQRESNLSNILDPDNLLQRNQMKQIRFNLQDDIRMFKVDRNNQEFNNKVENEDDDIYANIISEGLEDGTTDFKQYRNMRANKNTQKSQKECCVLF